MSKKELIGMGLTAVGVLIALWAVNNVGPVAAIVGGKK